MVLFHFCIFLHVANKTPLQNRSSMKVFKWKNKDNRSATSYQFWMFDVWYFPTESVIDLWKIRKHCKFIWYITLLHFLPCHHLQVKADIMISSNPSFFVKCLIWKMVRSSCSKHSVCWYVFDIKSMLRVQVAWDVMLCYWVKVPWWFEGTYCLLLQEQRGQEDCFTSELLKIL